MKVDVTKQIVFVTCCSKSYYSSVLLFFLDDFMICFYKLFYILFIMYMYSAFEQALSHEKSTT